MARELRWYQREAVDAVRAHWAAGKTRTAVVLPTGSGKSSVLGQLAVDEARAGGRVLILCHLGEALDQITDTCRALDPQVPIGRVQADLDQRGRPITMASVQTLAGAKRRARMARPTLVIVDEAHHVVSPSYLEVLRWAGSLPPVTEDGAAPAGWAGVRTVGVTATMSRGDRLHLGDVWQSCAYQRDIAWGIEQGWLVRPFGRVVVADHVDLKSAKVTAGDYQDGELGRMVAQDVDQIAQAWCDHADNRITVAFTPNVDSARALCGEFESRGVKAEVVVGSTPRGQRSAIYTRLAAGVTRILVNVMVATEAFDCPPISCILMARPTRLPGLYAQVLGRGLRLHPGKTDCLVLDVVGASRGQRLASLVDLFPSAVVDLSELEELPCEDCGTWPCTCEREGPARDPLGGRQLLEGPQTYEDIDLLMTESNGAWLATRAGHPFLVMPGTRRAAIIFRENEDTYQVSEVDMRGRLNATRLAAGATLDEARRAAENAAIARRPHLASPHSVWRTRAKTPTFKLLADAVRYGIPSAGLTAAELSERIDVTVMSERMDPLGPGAAARGTA